MTRGPACPRALAAAGLALALAGCAGLFPQPYGEAAPDADPVRADGEPVRMPPNAPSILNGHWEAGEGHQGIDILGPVGTPVLAPAPGRVSDAWFGPMYGHQILIDHGRGPDGQYIRTRLVHLDARAVEPGDPVARGQSIGALGRTGLLSGGILQLHYEVQTADRPESHRYRSSNPHLYWTAGAGLVSCFERDRTYPEQPFQTTYPVPCAGLAWE